MAGTRRSRPADGGGARDPLLTAVERALATHVAPGARIVAGVSGGRDSVALLAALAAVAPSHRTRLIAVHVHHGLSAHADRWAEHCEYIAAAVGVPLVIERVQVDVEGGLGIEGAAREARHAALSKAARAAGAEVVVLAHHQDDQAETLLLQLGRGAGVSGLAAMPVAYRDADGVTWLRPLLDIKRSEIDAFVRERALAYVDDDSNASLRHRRNALRARVVPALRATFDGYPATLARAASHQAEAARLLDDLAALDAQSLVVDGTLARSGLATLSLPRARNLLRWFVRGHGLRPPSQARLDAMLLQLRGARNDSRVRLYHDGSELGIHRDRIVIHAPAPPPYTCPWRGEAMLALPHGRLHFEPATGQGLAAARLAQSAVLVRPRQGGERLQLSPARPRRALKAWLQESDLPAWEREALPLVFCDDVLAAVPGLGVDVAFQVGASDPGFVVVWQPKAKAG